MATHPQIGIYAPYTWDEATQMACILGDLAKQLAYKVSYVSVQSHNTPIHFRWDHIVRNSRHLPSFKRWAHGCSHIVWFDVYKNRMQEAKQCGCRNIIVPLWHRLDIVKRSCLREFDTVMCPAESVFRLFDRQPTIRDCRLAQWDSGLRAAKRPAGLTDPDQIRLYISVDGATVRQLDSVLFSVLHLLIDTHYHLHVTIAHTKQWSRAAADQARALMKVAGGRVRLLRKPSHTERLEALNSHDWVFCPSLTPNSGVDALEALATGAPVIAFNVPPFNEFIRPGYNGALIKCETLTAAAGAVCGLPNSRQMYEALNSVLGNNDQLIRLQNMPWPDLETRSRAFQQVWRKAWD